MNVARTTLLVVGTLAVAFVVLSALVLVGERAAAHPGHQPLRIVSTSTP